MPEQEIPPDPVIGRTGSGKRSSVTIADLMKYPPMLIVASKPEDASIWVDEFQQLVDRFDEQWLKLVAQDAESEEPDESAT